MITLEKAQWAEVAGGCGCGCEARVLSCDEHDKLDAFRCSAHDPSDAPELDCLDGLDCLDPIEG